MIWTIIQISLLRLLHNRVELLLTFVVPIAFFSVFALIFGTGIGSGTTPKVKVVLVDTVKSDESAAIAAALRESAGLRFMDGGEPDDPQGVDGLGFDGLGVDEASEMVRTGSVTIGITLKPGANGSIESDLLADASDQVAGQVVSALVGRELVISRTRVAANRSRALVRRPPVDSLAQPSAAAGLTELPDPTEMVQIVDVIGEGKANPVVSMYAAGIAVMFLLFGATGGGGVLLEERELRQRFGEPYEAYCRQVPRFFPRFRKAS